MGAWLLGCSPSPSPIAYPERLSAYDFFEGPPAAQRPGAGVRPYEINTPLFSDYAEKLRFVRLPKGTSARYQGDRTLDFPVGTTIAKTFLYPLDARNPSGGRRLVETRLLIREREGWLGLPYVWNDEQSDAVLQQGGERKTVAWVDASGERREVDYLVPSSADCGLCHDANGLGTEPLGTKPAQLHRPVMYAGTEQNQLALWTREGLVAGLPALEQLPHYPLWDDPGGASLDARARAYLDVNCAHCHAPNGPASSAALDLRFSQDLPRRFGVFKRPVAAGRGSGGRLYDIWPGRPEESILLLRLESTEPGVMMAELGRTLIDREGVALVRAWIAAMNADSFRSPSSGLR